MRSLFCLLAFTGIAAAESPTAVRVHRNHIASLTATVDGTDVVVTGSPGLTVWRSQTVDPRTVDVRAKASLPGCYAIQVVSVKDGKLASQTFHVHVVGPVYRVLVTNRETRP